MVKSVTDGTSVIVWTALLYPNIHMVLCTVLYMCTSGSVLYLVPLWLLPEPEPCTIDPYIEVLEGFTPRQLNSNIISSFSVFHSICVQITRLHCGEHPGYGPLISFVSHTQRVLRTN